VFKLPPDLLKRLEEAAAANATTVEAEIVRRLEASLPKTRGRRRKVFDRLVDLMVARRVMEQGGNVSQTIKHLSKKEPFKGERNLRRRYYKLLKDRLKRPRESTGDPALDAIYAKLEAVEAIKGSLDAKLARLQAGEKLSAGEIAAARAEHARFKTMMDQVVTDYAAYEAVAGPAPTEEELLRELSAMRARLSKK
jgi:hypothetical protein